MFDARRFLSEYKIGYYTEGKNVSPGWINIQCPFCGDASNHGGFNLSGEYYNCWKCGGRDIPFVIRKLIDVSLSEARSIQAEYTAHNIHLQLLNRKKGRAEKIDIPGDTLPKYHREYLARRGFDPDEIQEVYQVRGTGPAEQWDGHLYELRIIIPIIYNRQIVSFQGRDISGRQKDRYKGCPVEKSVINYKEVLYNLDNAPVGSRIIVVEGITDVWRMGSQFVASFGTTMTPPQIKLLSRYDEIFFLFDPERDAQEKARRYASQLSSMGKSTEVIRTIDDRDPADLSPAEAVILRKRLLEE